MLYLGATLSHFFKKSKNCGCPKTEYQQRHIKKKKQEKTASTSNFLIQPLLTTAQSFLYVQIRFRTFRIAITPSLNNYYNITNIPTTLYLSQMKRISCSHYFIYSQIWLTALSLFECKLVFCLVLRRVYVGRIYSSIAKDLKFDWPIQVTWKQRALVN